MDRKIKLIGLDLDGTVFDDKKVISSRTKEAINQALQEGIMVVPVTGRPITGVPKELLEAAPNIRYALTANGAMISDLETGEILYQEGVPYEQAQALVDEFIKEDIMVEPYIDGVAYAQKSHLDQIERFIKEPRFAKYFVENRKSVADISAYTKQRRQPLEKLHLLFPNQELREKTRQRLLTIPDIEVTSASPQNLEINKLNVNKGKSLVAFGERMGIKREEIMACGDSSNDIQMLKAVGLGIAMGNALPEVKAVADYITLTNNEDGVAYAIEKFALAITAEQ